MSDRKRIEVERNRKRIESKHSYKWDIGDSLRELRRTEGKDTKKLPRYLGVFKRWRGSFVYVCVFRTIAISCKLYPL